MEPNGPSDRDEESAEYEDMFLCSKCGFSRPSIEIVIEHLETAHNGQGKIREYQREKKPKGSLRLTLEWFNELLERYSF